MREKAAPFGNGWLDYSTAPLSGQRLLIIAILISAVIVAFQNSLSGGLHFDDESIFSNPLIAGSGTGAELFRWSQTRPLTFLTFHWNLRVWGGNPFALHFVSVALHIVNAILVYAVAQRVVPSAAWVAGALFAIHPLQTQAVNYVFERATLLATLFALLSLWLFLRERYAWAVVAFAVSLLAKEETTALPAFLLLLGLSVRRHVWKPVTAMLVIAAVAAVRLFLAVSSTPSPTVGFAMPGLTPVKYALTQCRVVWQYVGLFLFPSGLNLDHDVRLSTGLFDPVTTGIGLVGMMAALALVGWLALRKGSVAALWVLGFFILLAPSSSIVPVQDLMFEHRAYLPLGCLAVAAALLFTRLPRWRNWAFLAVLALLMATTIRRNEVWHDEETLWSDVVAKSPEKSRGYFHLARHFTHSEPIRARGLYETGLRLEPGSSAAWMNLGLLQSEMGDVDAGLASLKKSLDLHGDRGLVLNNIGALQLRRGDLRGGIDSLRGALKADPCRFDARMNLIRALAALGERATARESAVLPGSCVLLPDQQRQLAAEADGLR